MQSRKLILFGIVTAVALVAAVVATHVRAPAPELEKALLFPDLRARAADVAGISLTGHGRTVTLARDGERWVAREADGFPVLPDRVRDTVLGAAGLRKLADKTSNAKMFKRLGVEDIKDPESNSVLLEIKDAKGALLAGVIVGRERRRTSPAETPALYVRLPEAANALLVEGALQVSTDLGQWLDRDLFDIRGDRVRSVEITQADGSRVRLARAMPGGDLELADVPAGREAQSSVVLSRTGTVLESFFIEGARAAGNVTLPADAAVAVVHTFDGVQATFTSALVDGKPMTRVAFAYEAPGPDAAAAPAPAPAPGPDGAPAPEAPAPVDHKAEAEQLAAKTADWVFQVPRFKFDLLTQRMDALVREPLPKGQSPIKLPE